MLVTGCHEQPLLDLQEKAFPVRSVPESLQQAAEKSLESLRKQGASESDVMKAILDWAHGVKLDFKAVSR